MGKFGTLAEAPASMQRGSLTGASTLARGGRPRVPSACSRQPAETWDALTEKVSDGVCSDCVSQCHMAGDKDKEMNSVRKAFERGLRGLHLAIRV